MKKGLQMEQFIAGALLKFDSISSCSLSFLVSDFLQTEYHYYSLNDFVLGELEKYIDREEDKISLKHSSLKLEKHLHEKLEQMAGESIKKYFQKLDLEILILKKIEHFSSIKENSVSEDFCKREKQQIEESTNNGYLIRAWSCEELFNDFKVVRLTKKGQLKLFKTRYQEEIRSFVEKLKSMKYDICLLDDYLLKQDLEKPASCLLTIENLYDYCNNYDRSIRVEEESISCDFIRLKSNPKTILEEDGKKKMQEMLSVWDNHGIYICHPNHIFCSPCENNLDDDGILYWDDIDASKMLHVGDYKIFISPDCTQAFQYVHKRLGHQVMKEMKKGNTEASSYLAVVEQYISESKENFLVRGIIRGDKEGYSLAFNRNYQKTIPQSIWEKALRLDGEENRDLGAYMIKRK